MSIPHTAEFIGITRSRDNVCLASVFSSDVNAASKKAVEQEFKKISGNKSNAKIAFKTTSESVPGYKSYYSYDAESGLFYNILAKSEFPERLAWNLERAAKDTVKNSLSQSDIDGASAHGLNKTLRKPFDTLMEKSGSDKLAAVHTQMDEVKTQMGTNLSKATANVEAVEDLEKKATQLQETSTEYQTQATKFKRFQQLKKWQWIAIFFAILFVLIIIIVAISGGFSGSGSSSSNSDTNTQAPSERRRLLPANDNEVNTAQIVGIVDGARI